MSRVKHSIVTGAVYGRLTVLGATLSQWWPNGRQKRIVVARCECGNVGTYPWQAVWQGQRQSCGCSAGRRTTHGASGQRLYGIWADMKYRCNPASKAMNAHRYGGRGIRVCDEWQVSFEAFRDWSHANGYADNLTIDRIDNDGHYEPANCRWVSAQENIRNRPKHPPASQILVTAFGETKNLTEWSADPRCRVTAVTLSARLKRGVEPEAAITKPGVVAITAFGETKLLAYWERDPRCVVSARMVKLRLEQGFDPEAALTTPATRGRGLQHRQHLRAAG